MRNRPSTAWGDYDRDDPFPLFAQVRAAGPVHEVTLADGHRAFLVVGYGAAQGRAEPPGPVQGHARGARPRRRGRRRGAARSGASPATCSASTRPTTPGCAGWPRPRSAGPDGGPRAAHPAARRPAARRPRRAGRRAASTWSPGFAGPLPFAVIGELLGIDRADQDQLAAWFATLLAPYVGAGAPGRGRGRVGADRRVPDRPRRPAGGPRRARTWSGTSCARPTDGAAHRAGAAVDAVPARRRRARHHDQPDRQRRGRAAPAPGPARRARRRPDAWCRTRSRSSCAGTRRCPHSTFRYAVATSLGGTVIPAGVQVLVSLAAAGRDPSRYADPETLRHRPERPRATWPSATASTTASAPGWPGWRRGSRSPRCSAASPAMRLAVPPDGAALGPRRRAGPARAVRAAGHP